MAEFEASADAHTAREDGPRVVSLAPSATATLAAMGADDLVVGVTDHCSLNRPSVGGWLTPDYDRPRGRPRL
jgi:iron complex transport system substrate-binding protein